MKLALQILAWLLILAGVVWFFQGINILPGSFMTGQIEWAIGGIFAAAVGIWLRGYARRR